MRDQPPIGESQAFGTFHRALGEGYGLKTGVAEDKALRKHLAWCASGYQCVEPRCSAGQKWRAKQPGEKWRKIDPVTEKKIEEPKPEPVKVEELKPKPVEIRQPVAVIETVSGEQEAFELPIPKRPRGRERKYESNAESMRAYWARKRANG
jgi:hypothetical protein